MNKQAVLKTEKKQKRGNPNLPKPGPGRPKGLPNKFTTLKQSFLEVFNELGGTQGLLAWVKESKHNKALFYGWITKMLPSNIDVEPDGALQAILERIITDKRPEE